MNAESVIDALAPVVAARVAEDGGLPWAVFGYSLGGLLAYDLVARLADAGGPMPSALLVGGAEPPHVARRVPDVSWLPANEFREALRDLGGTPREVLDHPELLELLMPMVRADFRIVETHPTRPRPPLGCPIRTYRGTDDREVDPAAVLRWGELSHAGTTHRTIPGGHFVITERAEEFASLVGADLDEVVGR